MARVVRKTRINKLNKSKKKDEEKKVEPKGFWRETWTILLFVLAVFITASLYSYLGYAGPYPRIGEPGPSQENLMGPLGHYIAAGLFALLGWCSFVTAFLSLLLARVIWVQGLPKSETKFPMVSSVAGSIIMLISCASIASALMGFQGGGIVGSRIAFTSMNYVNKAGTLLIAIAVLVVSLSFSTGLGAEKLLAAGRQIAKLFAQMCLDASLFSLKMLRGVSRFFLFFAFIGGAPIRKLFRIFPSFSGAILRAPNKSDFSQKRLEAPVLIDKDADEESYELAEEIEEEIKEEEEELYPSKGLKIFRPHEKKSAKSKMKERLRQKKKAKEKKPPVSKEVKEFKLPPGSLLLGSDASSIVEIDDEELIANCKKLEQALANFKIGGKIVEVHPGPVITLYQLELAPGVKVQRILNLADDLALALKVASVRVYAPVPGKGTVGIEVPNMEREIVRLRDIIECEDFTSGKHRLSLALGKDTFGDAFVADLAAMPHLLIAGATGSGKSVCINSILLSLLYRNKPEDLQLILIDPKMLELSVYEDIPHLKAQVVTNPRRAKGVLWWATEEMERRYRVMKEYGVRNISGFNAIFGNESESKEKKVDEVIELQEKDVVSTTLADPGVDRSHDDVETLEPKREATEEKMPRIVIVVDELADLMLTVGRDIEELLTRLAQKARAAGIHLILATQRPSVNVVTGLIKANFPARISFKVASKIDARTVMDSSGAEKLLGHGDLLFMSPQFGRAKRLHAPFVSDKEVNDVVDWLRAQGEPRYDESIEKMMKKVEEIEAGPMEELGEDEYDPLYDQAVNIIVEKGQASTSMVQRIFRIGYNRAARMLETMEREGIVGPADGAKPRQVLVTHDGE